MKFSKVLLILLSCICSTKLFAQDTLVQRYSLQLDYGLSRTLHYQEPINLTLCFEGCFAEEQKASFASNIHATIYRSFNQRNSLKFGLGMSKYRFLEKGLASPGDPSLLLYERIRALRYWNVSLGLRHIIAQKKQVYLFTEVDLIYEHLISGPYLVKRNGMAIKPQIGILTKLSDKWTVVISGFYKTGFIHYNKEDYRTKVYIPFAYGLQIGFNKSLK